MPLYEYECRPHGHRFEVRHGINENPVQTCPECGAEVRRVIHPVGIVFKGSGFYATDSRKSNPASKPAASASEAKTDGSGTTDTASTTPAKSEEKASSKKEASPAAD